MTSPRYFIIVAILFLLWNLMGDAAYLLQVTEDLSALAKTDAYQARLFGLMPTWAWVAYAIAVWVGTLATILLLFRRALAVSLYLVSLIAVVAQFSHTFFGTDILAVKGVGSAAFPAFILAVAVVQLVFAWTMVRKGVLK
jgi:hypothetical protein